MDNQKVSKYYLNEYCKVLAKDNLLQKDFCFQYLDFTIIDIQESLWAKMPSLDTNAWEKYITVP
ncbi:hypothetical protein [Okeania sp. SIO2B3]|uniref:hypothetical protein n=1 Tax=Okeania sp. SIO2B3 TaxID=2607784 RepID=UPI0025DA6303|nr:hypothetical protein [Okeania sp. SIO2B3]